MSTKKFLTTADDAQIYYEVHLGKKNAHLIFLHGLGGDLTAWNDQRQYFDELGFSTIAIDLRGHGLSERRDDVSFYAVEKMVDDIMKIAHIEKVKHAVVVGHCFGGMVAICLAAHAPSFLQNLILVDTNYKPPFLGSLPLPPVLFKYFFGLLSRYLPNIHIKGHVDFSNFVGTDDIDVRRIASDIMHTSLKSYFLLCQSLVDYSAEDLLEKIHVPTLVITGSDDIIFPPEVARHIASRIKHSDFEQIEQANHILIINNPENVNASIERFIKKTRFFHI